MTGVGQSYDVAVIGAGVFGAWTAYRLRQQGASVILIDQYGPANSLASSGGETRIMRRGYGPDEIYSRSANRSLEQWKYLSARTGQSLFYRTGVLWLAREDDPYSVSTLETFERNGIAFEKLKRAQILESYPQIQLGPVAWAIFEPDGGALMARRGVQCVVQEAEKDGVSYLADSVLPPNREGKLTSVLTVSGRRIEAGIFVFACGPWLPKVFPDLLDEIIQVSRQEVFHFAVPQGDSRFSPPAMPVLIDFNDLVYAIPNVENYGFKLAIDAHGPEFDPDSGHRATTEQGLGAVRDYLSQRIPAIADAELVSSQVCQYENTSNGDFLIDWHPSIDNILLVGGGSGHGFKHGPAVGEYITSLILGGDTAEPRFGLSSKERIHRRQVY